MTGNLFAYTHNGGGSIIGSMIKIEADDVDSDAVKACAKDLLLQITASAPQFVAQADVPASVIEAEKLSLIHISPLRPHLYNQEVYRKSEAVAKTQQPALLLIDFYYLSEFYSHTVAFTFVQ